MLTDRDHAILDDLKRFGIMSRDHIAKIHCHDVANPAATASRIMLRLSRLGYALQLPQPKDQPYLYKHAESNIRHNSSRQDHYLALVDTYIELGMPDFFEIEPDWQHYRPDVYCRVGPQLWCIEVQRSHISSAKVQKKINDFVISYQREEHDALNLWIKTRYTWRGLQAPNNFDIKIAPVWRTGG